VQVQAQALEMVHDEARQGEENMPLRWSLKDFRRFYKYDTPTELKKLEWIVQFAMSGEERGG
jgi:hypothetical protein